MPLYEFYCEPCHTVFTFRFQHVNTTAIPNCPRCQHPLKREVSRFMHFLRNAQHDGSDDAYDADIRHADIADAERNDLLAKMEHRMHALDDADASPEEALYALKKMASEAGVSFNADVSEALARLESGEDVETVCDRFAEVFESENPFADESGTALESTLRQRASLARYLCPPRHDPVWYDFKKQPPDGELKQ